jgi:hypothetical protein
LGVSCFSTPFLRMTPAVFSLVSSGTAMLKTLEAMHDLSAVSSSLDQTCDVYFVNTTWSPMTPNLWQFQHHAPMPTHDPSAVQHASGCSWEALSGAKAESLRSRLDLRLGYSDSALVCLCTASLERGGAKEGRGISPPRREVGSKSFFMREFFWCSFFLSSEMAFSGFSHTRKGNETVSLGDIIRICTFCQSIHLHLCCGGRG